MTKNEAIDYVLEEVRAYFREYSFETSESIQAIAIVEGLKDPGLSPLGVVVEERIKTKDELR